MKQLNTIKEMLVSVIEGQMSNLSSADTKEMGEVIDMIKDLAEAEYYCTITEAMTEKEKEKYEPKFYPIATNYGGNNGDMDRGNGKMYYDEYRYPERELPFDMRDYREGRSGRSRKMYMESKEMHKGNTPEDKEAKRKELDKWMTDIGSDIKELVHDMSAEEKQTAKTKLTNLANSLV